MGKRTWLLLLNRMLSGVLVLLGFSSCGEERIEYGSPYASYEVKGKVTDTGNTPLKDMRIQIKRMYKKDGTYQLYPGFPMDTLYTDSSGKYLFKESDMLSRYRVICEDPNNAYTADSTEVTMEPSGGSGWYMGSDSKEVNFQLKKK